MNLKTVLLKAFFLVKTTLMDFVVWNWELAKYNSITT